MHSSSSAPRVTVVIASYNYEKYIGEAIESILAQTYDDWELVIVDDASPDSSADIIRQYQQQYPDKIRFTELAQNRGVGYVANLCYDMARGEFIAHLGSDDRMLPERLAKQVAYFDAHPDTGVVCSDVRVIDGDGQGVSTTTLFARPITDLRKQLLEGNFINSPSAMLKKEVFDTVGKLNPALLYVQDYEHWLRVLDQYDIVRLDEQLTEYRIHGKNLSVANAGFHAYAGSYETVISSLRAIQRRDLQLVDNPDKQAVIEAKLDLVRSALKVEQSYLSELRLSLAPAYFMLLDIVEMDPDSVPARQLLNDIYAALGDVTRAQGKKPLTVIEYQQSRQTPVSGSLLDQAISCANSLKSTLPRVVGSMLAASKEKALSEQEKQALLLSMSEHLCRTAIEKADYAAGVNLSDSLRESLYQAVGVFNKHVEADLQTPELLMAKTTLRQLIEQDEYQAWITRHQIREVDAEIMAERMMLHWHVQPVIHCFMFVLPGEEALLADTIDSLASQLTKSWQLTVVAAGPVPDPVFDQADFLHWRTIEEGEEAYSVLNQEISQHLSHWVTLIEPGMQYSPHSLLKIADAINLHPASSYFYSDDDEVDSQGIRCKPRFKPNFNLDLLRSSPYIGNGVVQATALIQMGGFHAVTGVENYELALRWVDTFGESAFCHIPDVLMHRSQDSQRLFDAERGKAVL
jgi:glycosyltransferase involved in cell wall biosynthesis